ncbi:MAG: hypothetical protein ACREQO_22475 [Candidatus Binatia bacterium]
MNRKELEKRIWGKSIASARTTGLISEQEADFLLDQYLTECKAKTDWNFRNFGNLFGGGGKSWSIEL